MRKTWMKMVEHANNKHPGSVIVTYWENNAIQSNNFSSSIPGIEKNEVHFCIKNPVTGEISNLVWNRRTMQNWMSVTHTIRTLFGSW